MFIFRPINCFTCVVRSAASIASGVCDDISVTFNAWKILVQIEASLTPLGKMAGHLMSYRNSRGGADYI